MTTMIHLCYQELSVKVWGLTPSGCLVLPWPSPMFGQLTEIGFFEKIKFEKMWGFRSWKNKFWAPPNHKKLIFTKKPKFSNFSAVASNTLMVLDLLVQFVKPSLCDLCEQHYFALKKYHFRKNEKNEHVEISIKYIKISESLVCNLFSYA